MRRPKSRAATGRVAKRDAELPAAFSGATGTLVSYVPAGSERDELLGLVRVGIRFAGNHGGSQRGFLHRHVVGLVRDMPGPVTFESLIVALEREAFEGEGRQPTQRVSRALEEVTYQDPTRGSRKVSFGWLGNILTAAKKEIHGSR